MQKAIIFDLYGTLLQFNQRAFVRDLVRALRLPVGGTSAQGLRALLIRKYPSETEMLADWCRAVGLPSPGLEQLESCRSVLQKHLAEIRPYGSVRTLLGFLRRRGFKLGLLSNAAEVFTIPFRTLKLDTFFDRSSFSCDTGLTKPDPATYLALCMNLGVSPEQCLFIGDSLGNDYRAPLALGMSARCLRQPALGAHGQLNTVSELLWASFNDKGAFQVPLVAPTASFRLGSSQYSITRIISLPDEQQGRYNIVGRVACTDSRGAEREFHCKRFLAPESAHVEHIAYQVLNLLLSLSNQTALLAGPEPLLLVPSVPGRLWSAADMDESTAEHIGAHCAVSYLIGNADLRPRNTFIHRDGCGLTVSVIDLEHCFFDRALDLRDVPDPMSPVGIDRLGASASGRTKHRVLSPAATRRTRRSFLPVDDRTDGRVRHFRSGWLGIFDVAKKRRTEIEAMLLERIYRSPHLIVGTHGYRRAMAGIDVDDILQRIQEDPAAAFDRQY